METVKHILQVFPEAVLIQSYDEEAWADILKFANDTAMNELFNSINLDFNNINENCVKIILKSKEKKMLSESADDNSMTLHEFLRVQKGQWPNINEQGISSSQSISVINEIEMINQDVSSSIFKSESKYYNVKTIKVDWRSSPAFMHVFIDITDLK